MSIAANLFLLVGRALLLYAVAHASPLLVLGLAGSGRYAAAVVGASPRPAFVQAVRPRKGPPDDELGRSYFWYFLKGSLFSTGGFGNLPFLHQDLIAQGWAHGGRTSCRRMAVGQRQPWPERAVDGEPGLPERADGSAPGCR